MEFVPGQSSAAVDVEIVKEVKCLGLADITSDRRSDLDEVRIANHVLLLAKIYFQNGTCVLLKRLK